MFSMTNSGSVHAEVTASDAVYISSTVTPDFIPSAETNDYSELLKATGISSSSSTSSNDLSDLLDSFPTPPTFIPNATANGVSDKYQPFDGSAFSASLTSSTIASLGSHCSSESINTVLTSASDDYIPSGPQPTWDISFATTCDDSDSESVYPSTTASPLFSNPAPGSSSPMTSDDELTPPVSPKVACPRWSLAASVDTVSTSASSDYVSSQPEGTWDISMDSDASSVCSSRVPSPVVLKSSTFVVIRAYKQTNNNSGLLLHHAAAPGMYPFPVHAVKLPPQPVIPKTHNDRINERYEAMRALQLQEASLYQTAAPSRSSRLARLFRSRA